ncbi:MAG: 6-phosphogluconolactonase [Propionibacteriaceae bacterium]
MDARLHRFRDLSTLTAQVASQLLTALEQLQAEQDLVQLCLCGGRTANAFYTAFAEQFPTRNVDPSRLELWWSDDRYLPTEDPARYAGQALALLGGAFPLATAHTHLMPSHTDNTDVDDAALEYAAELGDTAFDICLLSVSSRGDIASLRASDPSVNQSGALVVGVQDWDNEPWERLTLTTEAINRAHEVWVLASGPEKATATAKALNHDPALAASLVSGTHATHWFVDADAARELPYYHCGW